MFDRTLLSLYSYKESIQHNKGFELPDLERYYYRAWFEPIICFQTTTIRNSLPEWEYVSSTGM